MQRIKFVLIQKTRWIMSFVWIEYRHGYQTWVQYGIDFNNLEIKK